MKKRILILLVVVLALAATASLVWANPGGLIAYWPLDGNAYDASGHALNGTVVGNGATFDGGNVAPIAGNIDALDFDGLGTNASPDYVSVADDDLLTPTGSALTIAAWIYPEGINLDDLHMVFGKWNDGVGHREYELMLQEGKIRFYAYDPDTGLYYSAMSDTTIGAGFWYHVAGVWNGTHLQVYINGSADGSPTAFDGPIPNTDAVLTIGAQLWTTQGWWRFFNGVIDEVGVWDRALSADEVAFLASPEVEIDIKPGSFPNSINPNAGGVIPVAILTTADFDASAVDAQTVQLNGVNARGRGKSGNYGSLDDVDGDGDLDLIVHIENTIEWDLTTTEATLRGFTYDGIPIHGTDSISFVPPE